MAGDGPRPSGETETPESRGSSSSNRRGRSRGQRARRGGRPEQATTPASRAQAAGDASESQAKPTNHGARQGRRGGRGSALRGGRGGDVVPGTRRTFGGRLTMTDDGSASGSVSANQILNAGAPEFIPGQPLLPRSSLPARSAEAARGPLAAKSTASDLATRIHEDIANLQYECVICTNEVVRKSKVWSCSICWTAVHLECVRKWHSSEVEKDMTDGISWRCPGCNSPLTDEPGGYHCWCGKDYDPTPVMGLPPHSCGQSCSKPRATCPHPCTLECHAGPCPPCNLMGPHQACFCGKETRQKPCRETDYVNGYSCKEICGDLLPCGEHSCPRNCHEGLCGSCKEPVEARCYCGRTLRTLACEEQDEAKESFYHHGKVEDTDLDQVLETNWFSGSFNCGTKCDRKYDCGHHTCQESCHPQDEPPPHCPLSPDVVTRCPCGKTSLVHILGEPRQSCLEEVPHCDKVCGRTLPCGHQCESGCHTGPCGACYKKADISCRCGRTKTEAICVEASNRPAPECSRACQAQLSCGRHQCQERCCPGDTKARARKKGKQAVADEDIEAEHICTRICGRMLKCGLHSCPQICHKGPCQSCLEAIFDEITCACEKTVLYPPQPCGSRPPECRYECTKTPTCGHPKVQHKCHQNEMQCPNCPFLVEKMCVCGKKTLKNQPCYLKGVRCGLPCGKKLKCGSHFCKSTCHAEGECEDAEVSGSHCGQMCGQTLQFCEHQCTDTCHSPFACKEDRPCQTKIPISCECRRRKQEGKCNASQTNPYPAPRKLPCDDECARLKRNAAFADAFHIADDRADSHVPYSDLTLDYFRDNQVWSLNQERELREFAAAEDRRVLRCKPMPNTQRAFVHSLAQDFGLETESHDQPPLRAVSVYKTPRFVSPPLKSLVQALRIRASLASAASKREAATATGEDSFLSSSALVTEPFNGFLLSTPRFGLTVEEVEEALAADLATQPSLGFTTTFLPASAEVLLRAGPKNFAHALSPAAIEGALRTLRPAVARAVEASELASSVSLCRADVEPLQVVRRERGAAAGASTGGWNAVVSRAAQRTSRQDVQAVAATAATTATSSAPGRSGRVMLGFKKKKEPAGEENA